MDLSLLRSTNILGKYQINSIPRDGEGDSSSGDSWGSSDSGVSYADSGSYFGAFDAGNNFSGGLDSNTFDSGGSFSGFDAGGGSFGGNASTSGGWADSVGGGWGTSGGSIGGWDGGWGGPTSGFDSSSSLGFGTGFNSLDSSLGGGGWGFGGGFGGGFDGWGSPSAVFGGANADFSTGYNGGFFGDTLGSNFGDNFGGFNGGSWSSGTFGAYGDPSWGTSLGFDNFGGANFGGGIGLGLDAAPSMLFGAPEINTVDFSPYANPSLYDFAPNVTGLEGMRSTFNLNDINNAVYGGQNWGDINTSPFAGKSGGAQALSDWAAQNPVFTGAMTGAIPGALVGAGLGGPVGVPAGALVGGLHGAALGWLSGQPAAPSLSPPSQTTPINVEVVPTPPEVTPTAPPAGTLTAPTTSVAPPVETATTPAAPSVTSPVEAAQEAAKGSGEPPGGLPNAPPGGGSVSPEVGGGPGGGYAGVGQSGPLNADLGFFGGGPGGIGQGVPFGQAGVGAGGFGIPGGVTTGTATGVLGTPSAPNQPALPQQTEAVVTGNLQITRSGVVDAVQSDPALQNLLFSMLYGEVGSQGRAAQLRVLETMIDRAATLSRATGMDPAQALRDVLSNEQYYAHGKTARAARSKSGQAFARDTSGALAGMLGMVAAGSHAGGVGSGNASGRVGFGWGSENAFRAATGLQSIPGQPPGTTAFAGGERTGIEAAPVAGRSGARGSSTGYVTGVLGAPFAGPGAGRVSGLLGPGAGPAVPGSVPTVSAYGTGPSAPGTPSAPSAPVVQPLTPETLFGLPPAAPGRGSSLLDNLLGINPAAAVERGGRNTPQGTPGVPVGKADPAVVAKNAENITRDAFSRLGPDSGMVQAQAAANKAASRMGQEGVPANVARATLEAGANAGIALRGLSRSDYGGAVGKAVDGMIALAMSGYYAAPAGPVQGPPSPAPETASTTTYGPAANPAPGMPQMAKSVSPSTTAPFTVGYVGQPNLGPFTGDYNSVLSGLHPGSYYSQFGGDPTFGLSGIAATGKGDLSIAPDYAGSAAHFARTFGSLGDPSYAGSAAHFADTFSPYNSPTAYDAGPGGAPAEAPASAPNTAPPSSPAGIAVTAAAAGVTADQFANLAQELGTNAATLSTAINQAAEVGIPPDEFIRRLIQPAQVGR